MDNVGGVTAARNAQELLKDFVVLVAGCVLQTHSHQKESHAVQCVKQPDTEEISVVMEVSAALLIG